MSEEYKIGSVLEEGDEIKYIYGCREGSIVFLSTDGSIRWKSDCDVEVFSKATQKYNCLHSKIHHTLPDHLIDEMESELAIALYNSFVSDRLDSIDQLFQDIEKRILSTMSPNQAKLFLVLFSLLSSIAIIIGINALLGELGESYLNILLCAGSGVLGSVMSLMQRNSDIGIDLEDGLAYIFMQASFIPLLGLFSGICLYVLANSDIAFSFAKGNIYNLLALSIASGFSERFVPDLFRAASDKVKVENH